MAGHHLGGKEMAGRRTLTVCLPREDRRWLTGFAREADVSVDAAVIRAVQHLRDWQRYSTAARLLPAWPLTAASGETAHAVCMAARRSSDAAATLRLPGPPTGHQAADEYTSPRHLPARPARPGAAARRRVASRAGNSFPRTGLATAVTGISGFAPGLLLVCPGNSRSLQRVSRLGRCSRRAAVWRKQDAVAWAPGGRWYRLQRGG